MPADLPAAGIGQVAPGQLLAAVAVDSFEFDGLQDTVFIEDEAADEEVFFASGRPHSRPLREQ